MCRISSHGGSNFILLKENFKRRTLQERVQHDKRVQFQDMAGVNMMKLLLETLKCPFVQSPEDQETLTEQHKAKPAFVL